eukprot:symbB.v1.2.024242.t1/scaffold2279.1/size83532/9
MSDESKEESQEGVEESLEAKSETKIGLTPPVAPKMPSLDEMSKDLDVPSEMPSGVPSVIQPRGFSSQEKVGDTWDDSFETLRTLVDKRRVETALRRLPAGKHGHEGALLRMKCLIHLRKFEDAAEECESEELKESFEAQLFLAQLPWLLHSNSFGAMLKLQALSESWHQRGPENEDLHLQLLQVLSQLSLVAGHGHIGAEAFKSALQRGGSERKRQLWSLLGRHHLSWGNLSAAKDAFEKARSFEGEESTLFLNDGLLAMSHSEYSKARSFFESVSAEKVDDEEAVAAENNLAVCKFYTKDLRGACQRLEELVKKDPLRFLKPCILQNLASLYDFSQDASAKRRELQVLATNAQLEDLDPELFQAPSEKSVATSRSHLHRGTLDMVDD